jgi:ACT domain
MASTFWSFRVTVHDQPGGLAAVAQALGALGVNILDLDVHLLDCDEMSCDDVADDLRVELPYWVEPAMVEAGLREIGIEDVRARRVDPHELVDSQSRALDLARSLAESGATDADLGAALRTLLSAQQVWLGPVHGLATHATAEEALAGGHPVVGREWVKRTTFGLGARPWVVAIPWGDQLDRVALGVRAGGRFTSTEIARARAVLDLVTVLRHGTVGSGGHRAPSPRPSTPRTPTPSGPGDSH